MKNIKQLFFIAFLFCLVSVKAQVVNLRLDSTIVGIPGSINRNDTTNCQITIYNDSATPFVGLISLVSSINGTVDTGTASGSPVYYPNSIFTDSIPAHGSVTRGLVITGFTPPFIIGSSAVVIWPVVLSSADQVHITDSITTLVNVTYGVGINEPNDKNLKVFMGGGELIIQENDQYLLKNVKLYDVAGALLYQQELTISGAINMAPFAPGIYFAEINYADNTRRVVRVFSGK